MSRVWSAFALLGLSASADAGPGSGVARGAPHHLGYRQSADSAISAAEAALSDGRPWRATQILAPIVGHPGTRTPRATLLAATAAAGWGGWREVSELLHAEPWLDSAFDGAGHALLARAAVEGTGARHDSLALFHARRALAAPSSHGERGRRLVLAARGFERLRMDDSARAMYVRAAETMPTVADWLWLRAAAVTSDRSARAAMLTALQTDATRAAVPRVEARARERAGDHHGAVQLLDSLGDRVGALRVRLAIAHDAAARSVIRRQLSELIETSPGSARSREATLLLDRAFAPLTPREQLGIARSAAAGGPASRAAAGFGAALGAGLGSAPDRYAYGTVLLRLGRHDDAAAQFDRATASPALAGRARYQHARSLLRAGRLSESRVELRRVIRTHAHDTAAAAPALYLLADLATDEGRDDAARAAFLELGRRYPSSSLAPIARFRAAIVAFAHDSTRQAAREFDALVRHTPRSNEAAAARYWAGRAWAQAGDTAVARERWRTVLEVDPRSYYAMLAARRMGVAPWLPTVESQRHVRPAAIDSALARAALLDSTGLRVEARDEYDWVERAARSSTDRMLAAAAAFLEHDLGGRTIRLAAEALRRDAAPSTAAYRMLYPLGFRETIAAESESRRVDPAFVAALIRQESHFTPSATSPVGARGLMQIMPHVGRRVASARGYPIWDDALLYQPEISIQLGTIHLSSLIAQYRDPARVLAAYNAGESRVERWGRKPGASDPELFVERIPYVETRDYVRIVLSNVELYRGLHAL